MIIREVQGQTMYVPISMQVADGVVPIGLFVLLKME